MGFPREYQVCHKYENDISDMGAPTYWRLSRLQTQMTSEGTKDTTQEPEVKINLPEFRFMESLCHTAILKCFEFLRQFSKKAKHDQEKLSAEQK